jgi:HEAT repeat protein
MSLYENIFSANGARLLFLAAVAGALAMALPQTIAGIRGVLKVDDLVAQRIRELQHDDPVAQGNRGLQRDDAVAQRIRELQDDDPLVRRYAAWALGELEDTRGVRPLIERLEDRDADVRLLAAWGLGEIKDHMAIQPLIELLRDDDPLVREMAVLALGEIEHPAAVEPLTEAYRREVELREPVIWALGEIGSREADAARNAIFADWGRGSWENDEVWTGRLGSDEARAVARDVDALTAALVEDDPRMRRSAAEMLGRLGDERAVDRLLDALRDPEPSVRAMAIWALDETNPSRPHDHTK